MPGLINLDFNDIRSIMQDKGKAIMGTGEAEGENRAIRAAEQALSNPLLDDSNMSGAKGVLINITGGNDITLFEIDEAANRIKEEVDEDANIIFGSSFDDNLAGKIRVSIVATGIANGQSVRRPTPVQSTNYLEESHEDTPFLSVPQEEFEDKLAKLSANITPESIEKEEPQFDNETQEEVASEDDNATISILPDIMEEEENNNEDVKDYTDDYNTDYNQDYTKEEPKMTEIRPAENMSFEGFSNSSVVNDIPPSSSLFNAVINKTERNDVDAQLENVLTATGNSFSSKNNPLIVEEEPELFSAPQNFSPAPKIEEPEKLIVDENRPRTWAERLAGFSIAKRNSKKKAEPDTHYQEPITPSFAENDDDERNNLDFPSFLRRR